MPAAAKSPVAVAAKIVIDQLVFAPIATAVFFTFKCFSEGRPRCAWALCRSNTGGWVVHETGARQSRGAALLERGNDPAGPC